MTFRKIVTPSVPEPPGATWSNCLLIGREVVFSGVTARAGDGTTIGGDSMEGQATAIFDKIKAQLAAAGGHDGNIYRLVLYVTDIEQKAAVNAARAKAFKDVYPCSTLVEVSGFVFPGLLIEIDAFANLDIDLHSGTGV